MPVIEVHLLEGYDDTVKRRLGRALTDAVRFVIPAEPDAITVMTHEYGSGNYLRGGLERQPAAPLQDPAEIVRAYLDAMEARDLELARSYLGEGFSMTFPGAAPMTTLEELIAWSKPRYNFVRKTYESFEAFQGPDKAAIVYCHGTLRGEWPDGTPFEGIRFIDRFEIRSDQIIRQDVWNDLGETRMQAQASA